MRINTRRVSGGIHYLASTSSKPTVSAENKIYCSKRSSWREENSYQVVIELFLKV